MKRLALVFFSLFTLFTLLLFYVLFTLKVHVQNLPHTVFHHSTKIPLASSITSIYRFTSNLEKIFPRQELQDLNLLLSVLPQILAVNSHQEYLLLFQNNMELRPTGGFLGSYARIIFDHGRLEDIQVQDIYVPDGQLPGYVAPPEPIKKYLNSNGWFLRDSNWDPDFTRAAPQIEWFFLQGKEPPLDGLIAINLNLAKDLLQAIGPIYLPDYAETVTAANLYQKAQAHSEVNFFPGSTQKRDFLSQVSLQLFEAVKSANFTTQAKILKALYTNLKQKQILFWFKDKNIASVIRRLNWDGALIFDSTIPGNDDYLFIAEANLGVNKANCCIDRQIDHRVAVTSSQVREILTLTYQNHNPVTPQPPEFWGGGYQNYLRVYLPKTSQLESITIDNLPLQPNKVDQQSADDFLIIGFLTNIAGGQAQEVKITYTQPPLTQDAYSLKVQKQSGTTSDPYTLTLTTPNCPAQKLTRPLSRDFTLSLPLACK